MLDLNSIKSASPATWHFFSTFARFATSFVFGLILARLITPAEFGIYFFSTLVISLFQVVIDLGCGQAVIQAKHLSPVKITTAVAVSLLTSSVCTIGIMLALIFCPLLFQDQRIPPALAVSSLVLIPTAWSNISTSLLMREMNFRAVAIATLLSTVFGYNCICVILALLGFSYWSLILANVFQAFLLAVVTLAYERRALRASWDKTSRNELLGFGLPFSLNQIASFFSLKADSFVTTYLFGTASLGLYTRAHTIMELPVAVFGLSFSQLIFPEASKHQDNPERFRELVTKNLAFSFLVAFPLSLWLALFAEEVVLVLYGEQWLETANLLRILSLFGGFRMSYNTLCVFLKAKSLHRPVLVGTLASTAVTLVGSWLLGSNVGITGVCWSVGLGICLMWILMLAAACQASELGYEQVLGPLGRVLFLCLLFALPLGCLKVFGAIAGLAPYQTLACAIIGFFPLFAYFLNADYRQLNVFRRPE